MAPLPKYKGTAKEDAKAWLAQLGLHFSMKPLTFNTM
jgi:hypothetical protein